MSSQETETDKIPVELKISWSPEQRDTNGTNFLIEESYLGPTNLNNEEEEKSWTNNIL